VVGENCNEELLNLHSSPSIIRMLKSRRVSRACSKNGERRDTYRILVEKSEGKRPLGTPTHRWVDNIKMDLREIRWGGMAWIDLAQDRDQCRTLVYMVMNFWVP
jgi:hypothetical protein